MNTLWDIAVDKANRAEEETKASDGNTVFIMGGKNSGKTTMILRFLDRNEVPKSTVALEYTYARRSKGHNMAKDIGHLWELGGGTWLSKLMDIPLNPDTILHTAVFLVLDLSNPSEMWLTLETLLKSARDRIDAVLTEMKPDYPDIRETLRRQAWERLGEDQQDKSLMDPFPVPLIIIGSKYDLFQDLEAEKKKIICKTLRFVAHSNGASVQFFSSKIDTLVTRLRAIVTHNLFGTAQSKVMQTEYNKPLNITAGLDSMTAIGNVPLSDKDIGRVNAKRPIDLWKHCFNSHFEQINTDNPAIVDDPARDPKYAEPAIDTLRAQKDEELERYIRLSERRAQKKAQGAYE